MQPEDIHLPMHTCRTYMFHINTYIHSYTYNVQAYIYIDIDINIYIHISMCVYHEYIVVRTCNLRDPKSVDMYKQMQPYAHANRLDMYKYMEHSLAFAD